MFHFVFGKSDSLYLKFMFVLFLSVVSDVLLYLKQLNSEHCRAKSKRPEVRLFSLKDHKLL